MLSPILTRNRWMLKAHGQHIVIVKNPRELFTHPLLKAFLWALYLPQYPHITVEVRVPDRYKPDVIAFDATQTFYMGNHPVFWGEAGQVGRNKISALVRRYPHTHFAIAKWETPLHTFAPWVKEALDGVKRHAPFDVLSFPDACAECIDEDGVITLSHADLIWERF